jgi:hypothetical protein
MMELHRMGVMEVAQSVVGQVVDGELAGLDALDL